MPLFLKENTIIVIAITLVTQNALINYNVAMATLNPTVPKWHAGLKLLHILMSTASFECNL